MAVNLRLIHWIAYNWKVQNCHFVPYYENIETLVKVFDLVAVKLKC